jgi:hypothetical protein
MSSSFNVVFHHLRPPYQVGVTDPVTTKIIFFLFKQPILDLDLGEIDAPGELHRFLSAKVTAIIKSVDKRPWIEKIIIKKR